MLLVFPVVGFSNGAIILMGSGLLVCGPVTLVEHLGVIEIEEVEFVIGGNEKGKQSPYYL